MAASSQRMMLDIPEMRRIRRIHFVGIGGAGMCGIAEVLLNQGYEISGSDLSETSVTDRLRHLGAEIHAGHAAKNVSGADVVVTSSAIDLTNVEVLEATEHRIPVVRRAEMLGELMRYRHGIAVAGTHGKTTTTSLIASILAEAGLDPTFVIGGLLNSAAANAKLGASRYLVAEADESDASFLHLQPMVTVLTNIDRDHLNNYDGSFTKLTQAFLEFVHNLPFYGLLVACIDDPAVRSILPEVKRPLLTYGFDDLADIRGYDYVQHGSHSSFKVARTGIARDLSIEMNLPGQHNATNAMAAIAIATDEGVDDAHICSGLSGFGGVSRRFEVHGTFRVNQGQFLLVDDYGHHPAEVKATIESVRGGWPESRLVMVYQPHRYSRTLELFDQFVDVLGTVDHLILLEVYGAGEAPIPGATGLDLSKKLVRAGHRVDYVADIDEVPQLLDGILSEGDLILTQGAGRTAQLAQNLKARWHNRAIANGEVT
ncbi:MAG: UDP-N-acetylmuramate--L-alanine ligase [Proteobacteria bacterium]|jgi:UDP-N-acetylmuramate--alanine ligase|nr:UDP-N-acetylmuramate--L-alanine ligase [Pseudomonadota bacterium]MDA1299092.1 UDP-N-acetylmuramate--L-alanine ligase [Pseudomonadota bacterium]